MIVNTNNVQTQFQALLSSKTDLLQTLKQLEAEHASQQNALLRIRTELSSLSTQFQTSKYQYGNLTKKKSLLQAEIVRLESLMKDDERDLKALAEDVSKKEQEEWENKMEFVREMEHINEQWRDVLRRTEEERMKRCQWMNFNGCCEIAKVLQEKVSTVMSDPNGVNERDTNHDDNDPEKQKILMRDIVCLVQEWAGSVEEHKQVDGTMEAWKERIASLRTQVQKDNKEVSPFSMTQTFIQFSISHETILFIRDWEKMSWMNLSAFGEKAHQMKTWVDQILQNTNRRSKTGLST
jgi:predicted  nucleic acid-binding Zn-ribbon protein